AATSWPGSCSRVRPDQGLRSRCPLSRCDVCLRRLGMVTAGRPRRGGTMTDTLTAEAVARRVDKLNTASLARIIDPDKDMPGALGDGPVLPPDLLLPTAGLDEGVLDADAYTRFSRLALAAITTSGLPFEAILMAGFGLPIVRADDYTDPRI